MATTPKFLYRCNQFLQATGYDELRDASTGAVVRVALHAYKVVKTTTHGTWIEIGFGTRRWVSNSSRKRFAYPTKILAINGFRKRKQRQISILSAQLRQAEEALNLKVKDYLDCSKTLV